MIIITLVWLDLFKFKVEIYLLNRQTKYVQALKHGWMDRWWVKVSRVTLLKNPRAAFFSFLLSRALKVLRQHTPAVSQIDEALLMGRHLLASMSSLKTFFYMTQTWGWSLFPSAQKDFIHYLITQVCVHIWLRPCIVYTAVWLNVFLSLN